MVFSSHLFLFYFLPLALLLYFAAPMKFRNIVLTVVSYVFYGWANPLFVVLMLVSTLIDYVCGLVLVSGLQDELPDRIPILSKSEGRTMRQKTALGCSIVANLSLLGFFKYWNFGAETLRQLAEAAGWTLFEAGDVLHVVLPLGISFYTFQSMSYCIDVYRGDARAIRSFWDFACYVCMFPQLVAGPIVRFHDVSRQLQSRVHTADRISRGVCSFSLGLAKKVLIADALSPAADLVFAAESPSFAAAWLGVIAWAFQIYFDFSGYSDMAVGLGWILGFDFCPNFDRPYRAIGMADFWRRWHMSLSGWLRDYLYIPLGGNRCGSVRTSGNLLAVMLIGGLWHGAAWTYVIWGGLHGLLLLLERLLLPRRTRPDAVEQSSAASVRRLSMQLLTFLIICLTWVPFRASSVNEAGQLFAALLGFGRRDGSTLLVDALVRQPWTLWMLWLAAVIVWTAPQSRDFVAQLTLWRVVVCLALLCVSVLILTLQVQQPFIYFMF